MLKELQSTDNSQGPKTLAEFLLMAPVNCFVVVGIPPDSNEIHLRACPTVNEAEQLAAAWMASNHDTAIWERIE